MPELCPMKSLTPGALTLFEHLNNTAGVVKNGRMTMTKVQEIEKAVKLLPEADYTRFRQWFIKCDWERWDNEIEADAKSGRLNFLRQEAIDAKQVGNV